MGRYRRAEAVGHRTNRGAAGWSARRQARSLARARACFASTSGRARRGVEVTAASLPRRVTRSLRAGEALSGPSSRNGALQHRPGSRCGLLTGSAGRTEAGARPPPANRGAAGSPREYGPFVPLPRIVHGAQLSRPSSAQAPPRIEMTWASRSQDLPSRCVAEYPSPAAQRHGRERCSSPDI